MPIPSSATNASTQLFVTVNYGSGSPQEAAAWVAYANGNAALYGTTTSVGPKRNVPCIRVRPMIPKAAAEAIVEKPVDAAMRQAQDEAFARDADEGP